MQDNEKKNEYFRCGDAVQSISLSPSGHGIHTVLARECEEHMNRNMKKCTANGANVDDDAPSKSALFPLLVARALAMSAHGSNTIS